MSRPPSKKQGLSLNDVSQQVIALSTSNKDGLGPLLTGTLYEALSSTLVDIEEPGSHQDAKITVVLTKEQQQQGPTSASVIEVSATFLASVAGAGPTWPTTVLLSRLLSFVHVDAKNVAVWSVVVKSLLKVLSNKDTAASKIAVLECLGTLLKTKAILLSDVLRSSELFDQTMKVLKGFYGNTLGQAQVRVSLFRCLESLIQGIGFGQPLPQLHDHLGKIFKYWASCTEKSLQARAAAARCLAVWIPYAASSYQAISNIQTIVLKELPTSATFGHVYGCLLYTALKEVHVREAVQPAQNLPPQKPGSPPHDSAGILGFKIYDSLESILEHLSSIWSKLAQKREARDSIAAAFISFYSRTSLQYLEKKLPFILSHLFTLVSHPNTKLYAADIDEAKSSLSHILRSGILSNFTEDGKRLVFKELVSMLDASIATAQTTGAPSNSAIDGVRVSSLLAEIYSLFSEVGESVVDVVSTAGTGSTIEDILLRLISQQQALVSSPQHKANFSSSQSATWDGNTVWLWTGLVLKRYCAVNNQFFLSVAKLVSMLPAPVGSAAASIDPVPVVWAYANTKRMRPASSAEFGTVLNIAQGLLAGTETSWSIAGWMLLSSLLLRGTGQSAEQDRASMVSAHLATLQQLWKQELSKRPANETDITDFSIVKLWLLYSLKHFLANFSRLVHESNMTTFITQCLNTVLKSVTSWQSTNNSPKAERDCSAIDALIVALLQSYTTLATHIYNPPSSMSPRQQLQGSSESVASAAGSFPARSVLQMIAKQMVRTRYVSSSWLSYKYLHAEDDALEPNSTPAEGTHPASHGLYQDLHGCTTTVAHASALLWSEWSSALLKSRSTRSRSSNNDGSGGVTGSSASGISPPDGSLQQNASSMNGQTQVDAAVLYTPPAMQLLSEMVSLFPPLFHQQQASHQLQLLQYMGSVLASNTSHSATVHSNVLFFMLAISKENAKLSGSHQLGALLAASPSAVHTKPLSKELLTQIVSLANPYVSSSVPHLRRLAADILSHAVDADEAGFLTPTIKGLHSALWNSCGFNSSTPANHLPQPTASLAKLIKDEALVEGSMLALGSIHRVVGGIRSRQYMGETIKVLSTIVRISFETRPAASSSTPASTQHVTLHRTALHAMWIALESTGLTDTSFASSTLSMMLDGLVSDAAREWQTICHMGKIVGSIAAVLGPELQASESLLRRLQGAIILLDCAGLLEVEDAPFAYNHSQATPLGTDWVPPRSLAPVCLAFSAAIALRERLLLFAPQFINATRTRAKLLSYVRSMRHNTDFDDGSKDSALWSPVSRMRLDALRVLRFLAQLNPQAFQNDEVVRQVVLCTDREPMESAVRAELRVLIATLEETLVPLDPLKWLAYASHFVMGSESNIKLEFATSSSSSQVASPIPTKPAAPTRPMAAASSSSSAKKSGGGLSRFGADDDDDDMPEGEPMDETEEEMGAINVMSAPTTERISASDDDSIWKLSSSLTALFVSSLHFVFEPLKNQPAHFDAILASKMTRQAQQKSPGSIPPSFLVDSISTLVALASKASSAPIATLQIAGLEAVHDILQRFSEAADPQLENHFLLELFVAQMSAALRRCIARNSPVANRVCHTAYVVLAEMILWIANHVSDVAAVRQLLRPFLEYSLERQPLHAQTLDSSTADQDADSPITLELNPRYVAWLMASAVLWDGCGALQTKSPSEATTPLSPGFEFLHSALAADAKLLPALRTGWKTILEYRAVQQYSQDLTQLTLFGASSSSSSNQHNDILSQATSIGINWCHVLIAMSEQYAEHARAVIGSNSVQLAASCSEVSRDAHILFGLILHNLAHLSHINMSLSALERLMKCLSRLETMESPETDEDEEASPAESLSASRNLLPIPSLAVTELSQALANLLGVIHYRDYASKAQLLQASSATVIYTGLHNRTQPSRSLDTPPPPITHSFFEEDSGKASNQIYLKEIFIEAMEHGPKSAPSTRHSAAYLSSLLKNLIAAWPVLRPTISQQAEVALWVSQLPKLDTPDLPLAFVRDSIVPLALDFWSAISASSADVSCSLITHAISQGRTCIERIKESASRNESDEIEARFCVSAVIRSISSLPPSHPSFAETVSMALQELTQGSLAYAGSSIPALRVFIQQSLASGGELAPSILSVILPVLCQQFGTGSNEDVGNLSRADLELRQELLKLLVLLSNQSAGSPEKFSLVLSGLIRLLGPSSLPANSNYSTLHDSTLTILLHLAQTNPEAFKSGIALVDMSSRAVFEAAVRSRVEKQQAQQASAAAGKMKFSFDTSAYAK